VELSQLDNLSIGQSCKALGYARSSYYKRLTLERKQRSINAVLLDHVRIIRKEMPKIGCKKLHRILSKNITCCELLPGRDCFFNILRSNNLLIERKRKYAVTTNSNHPYKVYKNLIKKKTINRPNQVWVSDITYVRLTKGFAYVSLVTDHYSKKIVGYHVSNNLELKGCLSAIKMALRKGKPEYHHSDRGSQYCSYQYTTKLKKHQVKISMTENGNCYENAVAERINGILKHEFNLYANFKTIKQVQKTLKQAVNIYNNKRPHWTLDLKVPNEIHKAA
jgi:hypothetical protein